MPDGTDDPCRACQRIREENTKFETAQTLLEITRRAQFKQEILDCPDCDDAGWIEISDSVQRCPNHDWTVTHA